MVRIAKNAPPRREGGILLKGFKLLLFASAAAGAAYVGLNLRAYLLGSAEFNVREVEVGGCAMLDPAAVAAEAGLVKGMNIFKVDMKAALQRTLENPWVRTARIMRRLPSKLFVELTEHKPQVVVSLDRLYLADEEGAVFKRWSPSDGLDLPVVTGLGRAEFTRDAEVGRRKLFSAAELARAYRESGLEKALPLQEIHVSDRGWDLVAGRGTLVRLGNGGYERKLKRLSAVITAAAGMGRELDYVYLDKEKRPQLVVARLGGTRR